MADHDSFYGEYGHSVGVYRKSSSADEAALFWATDRLETGIMIPNDSLYGDSRHSKT